MYLTILKFFQEDWKKWNSINAKELKEKLDSKEKVLNEKHENQLHENS